MLLHFKERFWEAGAAPIWGGMSASDELVGQLYYPTREHADAVHPLEPGVLTSYTWGAGARALGAMSEANRIQCVLEGAGIEVSADAATKLGFDYLEHGQPKAGSNVTEYVVVGRWTLTDGQTVLLQDVLTSRAHNQGFLGTIKRMKKTAEESLRAQADKAVLALGWADST